MGRKQKHPEHVNLERYLVSYADFITLLFATFVVLYALSQVDTTDFSKLEKSLKSAFDRPTLLQGSTGMLDNSGQNMLTTSEGNSIIAALMMEYLSTKYEEESYESIKRSIDELVKSKELEGVTATIEDEGLVIKINDADILFKSASATLEEKSKAKLDKIGLLIAQRFLMHSIRVEGNTDNVPFANYIYPSNWELSSARACTIVRYFIDRFKFHPDLFSPVGYGSTRPIADNNTEKGRAANRRVDIIILRNKYKKHEDAQNTILKMTTKEQEEYRIEHLEAINKVKGISDAALKLTGEDLETAKNVIILNELYSTETDRLKIIHSNNARPTVEQTTIKHPENNSTEQ